VLLPTSFHPVTNSFFDLQKEIKTFSTVKPFYLIPIVMPEKLLA
jgi:hypothetical protein